MPSPRHRFAFIMALGLLLGLPGGGWSAPPACLGNKDLKELWKAKTRALRMVAYTQIAERKAAILRSCISPQTDPLADGPFDMRAKIDCKGIQDMLADVDCAMQAIRDELPSWRQTAVNDLSAFGKARWRLEMAESELGYAEYDSQRSVLNLPSVITSQIRSRRFAMQDLEGEVRALVPKENNPARSP